ncbi:MAG: hypothetical protein OEY22_00240 [Candidatus Bathyarchaeota archaeon]|nr:hypothetical protein [Candidatus Bathyarchaeota archaeon]MDH5787360.1 hypothetical protein [Candidatus Bathyarchaeota archaeon]
MNREVVVWNPSRKSREGFISAFSAGVFLILIGIIFVAIPGIFDAVLQFFKDFTIIQVPHVPGFMLPAPSHLANHTTVYSAVMYFSLAWGIFLVGLLMIRIFARSPLQKKAENTSDIVFWLASSFLVTNFLNEDTDIAMWFAFWATIIMLVGVSLVIRAIVLALFK